MCAESCLGVCKYRIEQAEVVTMCLVCHFRDLNSVTRSFHAEFTGL
jgi:cytochrome c553